MPEYVQKTNVLPKKSRLGLGVYICIIKRSRVDFPYKFPLSPHKLLQHDFRSRGCVI